MGIATDNVDRDWESTPHRRVIRMIRNFMLRFGLLSTVFDLMTFEVLLHLARESADRFRTGWFAESLITELLIPCVIRTCRPFFALFSLVPLPGTIMAAILLIPAACLVVSEFSKRAFSRRLETGQAK